MRLPSKNFDACAFEAYYHFHYMSLVCGLCSACLAVMLSYTVPLFGTVQGTTILGLFYGSSCLSAMLFTKQLVEHWGSRLCLVIGNIGYSLFCLIFALCLHFDNEGEQVLTWIVFSLSALIAGGSSSIWWIGQGVYYSQNVELVSGYSIAITEFDDHDIRMQKINAARSDLSFIWFGYYQLIDISFKIASTMLFLFTSIQSDIFFAVIAMLALVMGLLSFNIYDFQDYNGSSSLTFKFGGNIRDMLDLCERSEPMRIVLSVIVVYGFIYVLFVVFICGEAVTDSDTIGFAWVGIISTIPGIISIAVSPIYNEYAKANGTHLMVSLALVCFMLASAEPLCFSYDQMTTWTYVMIFCFLFGIGKCVFQISIKSNIDELFHGEEYRNALIIQNIGLTLVQSILSLIYPYLGVELECWVVYSVAGAVLLFYQKLAKYPMFTKH